jgi:NAD(P) transhydrogenase subunit beta
MDFEIIRNLAYLVAAVLFILGIKGLTHPRTAVRGNLLGALGMLLAAVATVVAQDFGAMGWGLIAGGIVVGAVVGAILAIKIQMTAMPQLVALFNGFGGLASFLVAGAVLHESLEQLGLMRESGVDAAASSVISGQMAVATVASGLIGAVTFSGSIVAFAKLQELISSNPITGLALKLGNAVCALVGLVLAAVLITNPEASLAYWLLVLLFLAVGIFLVMPIGGADMPVVIALLNSYSGLAAAATGFVINNNVLIIAGSLVGASGLILTKIMCVAMNRSLVNVLFGVMAEPEKGPSADEVYAGKVKSASPEEVAMLFDTARRVVIVPGYGMAVAQAQHIIRDLATLLESRGIIVEYGIHPVAGRMPGHMNVLLAEADVPYEQLKEMDEVNSEMGEVDVALVIGANDTVNPVAREDPSSAIAGMPIIDVDKARTVVVVKRSLSPGFAGIPNPLFAGSNTLMMFGDGKKAIVELVAALKESA